MFGQQPGFNVRRSSHNSVADRAHVSEYTRLYDDNPSEVDRLAILSAGVQLSGTACLPTSNYPNFCADMDRIELDARVLPADNATAHHRVGYRIRCMGGLRSLHEWQQEWHDARIALPGDLVGWLHFVLPVLDRSATAGIAGQFGQFLPDIVWRQLARRIVVPDRRPKPRPKRPAAARPRVCVQWLQPLTRVIHKWKCPIVN
ncbi:hypothetical protein BN2475_10034 [Paraburkholderia ribeironis]|uniref:Uncharacterized protein n=1 Tax=Paraburkholderia ribeironis TaxID=1247936 RepID=A0A1N7RID8_9BURK|nr:hypothetical protein BN2475_10034 [Paraburkholderia ribeironis]